MEQENIVKNKTLTPKQKIFSIVSFAVGFILILFSILFLIKGLNPDTGKAQTYSPNTNAEAYIDFKKIVDASVTQAKQTGLTEKTQETFKTGGQETQTILNKYYNPKTSSTVFCEQTCENNVNISEGNATLKIFILQATLNETYVEKINSTTYMIVRSTASSQPEFWKHDGNILTLNEGKVENPNIISSWETTITYELSETEKALFNSNQQ